VKILFVTSSQVKDVLKSHFPSLQVYWIPEGININKYRKGSLLKTRTIDLLELGRVMPSFHENIVNSKIANIKNHCYTTNENNLLFPDFDSLIEGLSNSKITVCYPRCYTHPEMAGDIETLTQRYWECMLSRTLIVGKAPNELIRLLGYNPVIEVDFNNIVGQISLILENIESYQTFVNKNYEMAIEHGSWEQRINLIMEKLRENGYMVNYL
jgi:hypothetical protein